MTREEWMKEYGSIQEETDEPARLVVVGKPWSPLSWQHLIPEGRAVFVAGVIGAYIRFRLFGVPRELLIELDGRELSREEWPELYEITTDTYGSGDGVTTFNVPNLKPRLSDD